MLYEAIFTFSKDVPETIKNVMIQEYNHLRGIVVDLLNPCYEQWNSEYTEEVHGEFDPRYNAYIVSKQRPIIEAVNRSNWAILTKLDCDEYADIIAVCKFDKSLIMHLTLSPVEES